MLIHVHADSFNPSCHIDSDCSVDATNEYLLRISLNGKFPKPANWLARCCTEFHVSFSCFVYGCDLLHNIVEMVFHHILRHAELVGGWVCYYGLLAVGDTTSVTPTRWQVFGLWWCVQMVLVPLPELLICRIA